MIVLFILFMGNLYLELSPKTTLSTQDFLGKYYINSYLPALLREEEPIQTVAAAPQSPSLASSPSSGGLLSLWVAHLPLIEQKVLPAMRHRNGSCMNMQMLQTVFILQSVSEGSQGEEECMQSAKWDSVSRLRTLSHQRHTKNRILCWFQGLWKWAYHKAWRPEFKFPECTEKSVMAMHTCNPSTGGRDRGITRTSWPVSLGKSVSSGSVRDSVWKDKVNQWLRKTLKVALICIGTHVHTWVHVLSDTYTYTWAYPRKYPSPSSTQICSIGQHG